MQRATLSEVSRHPWIRRAYGDAAIYNYLPIRQKITLPLNPDIIEMMCDPPLTTTSLTTFSDNPEMFGFGFGFGPRSEVIRALTRIIESEEYIRFSEAESQISELAVLANAKDPLLVEFGVVPNHECLRELLSRRRCSMPNPSVCLSKLIKASGETRTDGSDENNENTRKWSSADLKAFLTRKRPRDKVMPQDPACVDRRPIGLDYRRGSVPHAEGSAIFHSWRRKLSENISNLFNNGESTASNRQEQDSLMRAIRAINERSPAQWPMISVYHLLEEKLQRDRAVNPLNTS